VSSEKAQEWSRSIALRIHGEALLAAQPPQVEKAERAVRAAIKIQEQRECRCDLAWSRLLLGRVAAVKGELEEAHGALSAADNLFGEMGITRGRQLTQAALAMVAGIAGSGTESS